MSMQESRLQNIINQKIAGLEFLQNNFMYFSNHNFGDIPDFLLSRIEALSNCSLNTSVYSTHEFCKGLVNEAEQFVYCIFTQPPFLLANAFSSKLQTDIKIKFLFGKNSDIPECNDLVEQLHLDKPMISEEFEKRICEKVITNVVVSDKGACLILPDNNGTTELMTSIVGNNPSFVQWCCDFFEYKWNTGESFARLRC